MNKVDLLKSLDFMRAIDALKEVNRKTYILSQKRWENSAEHSWTAATLALVLKDFADVKLKIDRVVKMLLIHDVVEIDTGDVLVYSKNRNRDYARNELLAAERIFSILPEAIGIEFKKLWLEFAEEKTEEAKFAAALDRFIPVLHNIYTGGRAWKELNISYAQVIEKNSKIASVAPQLWDYLMQELDHLFKGNQYLP